MTCAKYRCDRSSIFETRAIWIFIEFERNMLSGTGARCLLCSWVWSQIPFQYQGLFSWYGNSHYEYMTVVKQSYLYNENYYTGKEAFFFNQNSPQVLALHFNMLIHCSQVKSYGVIDLGHHWFFDSTKQCSISKLFTAPIQTPILRIFGQVTHTISIWL